MVGPMDCLNGLFRARLDSTPAYALYVERRKLQAVELLDKLAASDPFEERPLIWKGIALSNAGQHANRDPGVPRCH